MQAIQQLAEEIKQIKTSLNSMDERIGTIEDDRYYHYAEQEQKAVKTWKKLKPQKIQIDTFLSTDNRLHLI